jgi:hypothetical protein
VSFRTESLKDQAIRHELGTFHIVDRIVEDLADMSHHLQIRLKLELLRGCNEYAQKRRKGIYHVKDEKTNFELKSNTCLMMMMMMMLM